MRKKGQNNTKEASQGKKTGRLPFYKKAHFKVEIGIIVGFVVMYFGFAVFFQSHFCFGTIIGGIDASGKSVEEMKKLMSEDVSSYSLKLIEREGGLEEISGSSIFVQLVFNGELEQMLSEQNGYAWLFHLFKKTILDLEKTVSYDENALADVVEELSGTQPANQRKPVNAGCSDYSEAGYVLVPADYGTVINKEKLIEAIGKAVPSLTESLDLDEAGCYTEPEVGDDNAKLLAMIDKLNTYTATTIHYDFNPKEEILDGAVISEWLETDENYQVTVNEEAVQDYVKSLASKYNTVYKTEKLMTSYKKEVTISTSCPYGWKIDNASETAQILEDLETGEEISREPAYSQRGNSHGENDYGDSYVEINLTSQHLFLYKNGELIVESDFVSGCVAKGYATPTGAFPVTYITKDAVLRGPGYETPVSYWMPFNGNIGMHDLSSRKAFGGNIYKTNGSHGCINLPYSAAKTIYENIEAGFPVLVYELPGTQSESVKRSEANTVIGIINSIGVVTLDSATIIETARNLYNALDSETKRLVTNYDILVSAEATLAQLQVEAANQNPPPDAELPVEQPVGY